MGVGQRVVRRAAHVGGVIVVARHDLVTDVLLPVYRHLGLEWDPATSGSVAAEAPGVGWDDVDQALVRAFGRRDEIVDHVLDDSVLTEARTIEPDHESPR
jgi:hypothetical protein